MPSRKHEKLDTAVFAVGAAYTRARIAELGGVAPLDSTREWTGIVEFENCVVLFPTLDKTDLPPEHRYLDVFEGDQFKWDSQNRNTQDSPVMVRILSRDTPILLFCRLHPKELGRPVPFTYVGQVEAVRARGQNPVSVLFNVLDYQQNPNSKLAELYNWRPSGGRKLDPVEIPDEKTPARSGQGRQTDVRKRQAVDAWAMMRTRQHYESLGYALKDTSKVSPFDYLARKNGEERRLEVKGLSGCFGPVVVTAGEVKSAREENVRTDLVIVHDIELIELSSGVFQGQSGLVHVIREWIPGDHRLKPLQYEYIP
jgi:hypothetical protein